MPGKDGTGPFGSGPVEGKARRRRQRGRINVGPAGYCICPKCGEKVIHTAGTPCTSLKCPQCESFLIIGS